MAADGHAQHDKLGVLSTVVQLLGVSILAYCFASRTSRENLSSFRAWGQISWARWLVILVFLDSWLFLFFSGLLISGTSTSHSLIACNLTIYSCIFFYGSSKVLIYLFLIEKVLVVWPHRGSRWTSPAYLVCLGVMSGYAAIIVLMILGKLAYYREDGQCVVGLKKHVSISLLTYDLFLNIFLTGMFLWPLSRHTFAKPAIRRVAARTLVAALAALTTSSVNVTVLTILHGIEIGWVCLGSCGTDVTLNAMILYWVTSTSHGDSNDSVEAVPPPSGRGEKSREPQTASGAIRTSVRLPDETSTRSSARVTFSMPGIDRQSHSYPTGLCEEEDLTETERKEEPAMPGFFARLGSVLGFSSRDSERGEESSVQVTITTEYEVTEEARYKREKRGDRSRRASSDNPRLSTNRMPR